MNCGDWNARYAEQELVWSAAPNRFLVSECESLPAGRALDLACGEGRNAIWLAQRGWDVTAIDFSDVAVEKGRARHPDVEWLVADVLEYEPEPESFDLVIVFYLHLPPHELERVLRKAALAVAPGGTFLLVGHDVRNLGTGKSGPKDAAVLYRAEEVTAFLDGLEVERAEPVDRDGAVDALVRARKPEPALPR